jgi:hypothetical protein
VLLERFLSLARRTHTGKVTPAWNLPAGPGLCRLARSSWASPR